MRKRHVVAPGQQYQEAGSRIFGGRGATWIVDSVFVSATGLRCARIVRSDDPLESKTISTAALADRARYRLIVEAPERDQAR